jgi:hypothetical protein
VQPGAAPRSPVTALSSREKSSKQTPLIGGRRYRDSAVRSWWQIGRSKPTASGTAEDGNTLDLDLDLDSIWIRHASHDAIPAVLMPVVLGITTSVPETWVPAAASGTAEDVVTLDLDLDHLCIHIFRIRHAQIMPFPSSEWAQFSRPRSGGSYKSDALLR